MAVRASDIRTVRAGGNGNMGDVTDRASPARFSMDADRFVVIFIRIHSQRIEGSAGGSDYADLVFKRDTKHPTANYNQTLKTVSNFGPDDIASVQLRVQDGEQSQWVLCRGDELVAEWTNPDVTQIEWSIEVGFANAESV